MYKKLFLLLLLIILVIGVYFIFIKKDGVTNGQKGEILYPLAPDTPIPNIIPATDIITLQSEKGSATVDNFLRNAKKIGDGFELTRNEDFVILYYRQDNGFIISINNTPLNETRTRAERTLLSTLNSNEAEACKLKVDLGIPRWLDIDLAGRNFGLSFCPDGISF